VPSNKISIEKELFQMYLAIANFQGKKKQKKSLQGTSKIALLHVLARRSSLDTYSSHTDSEQRKSSTRSGHE
jgi:hypothetical protein